MQLPTNVELHAAITHFPIVLIIVAATFELCGLLWRRNEARQTLFRQSSLILLALAVISSIPALLTGYLTGREMPMPPVGFDLHWQAAVVTSLLAFAALVGRLAARDVLSVKARAAILGILMLGVGGVSYTGHLGGKMVFGGRNPSRVAAKPPVIGGNGVDPSGRIDAAAGKMEAAAGKLDSAADRLATATGAKPADVAPSTPAAPPEVPAASPPQPGKPPRLGAPLPTATLMARLDRAATMSAKAADKVGQSTDRIATGAPLPSRPTTPTFGGFKRPAASAPVTATATVVPASGPDPALVAAGAKIYANPKLGCINCHAINGVGGDAGPDLTYIGGSKPDLDWHMRHIRNPQAFKEFSTMPAYPESKLNDADLRAIAAYLVSLK